MGTTEHHRADRMTRSFTASNPYLDKYLELCGGDIDKEPWHRATEILSARDSMVKTYAWAIPNAAAIAALVEHGPVVEIGAGTGYWAMLVAAAGGDIVAYDQCPPGSVDNDWVGIERWFDVQAGGPEQAALYKDRSLFLCWPPYASSFARECLEHYSGQTVLVVGEQRGGCTADDGFFELLEREYTKTTHIHIPFWLGLHDSMTIHQRK